MFPLDVINGLPYLPLRPFSDHDWKSLPHLVLTSDTDWDPTILDHSLTDDDNWYSDNASLLPTLNHGITIPPIPIAVNCFTFTDTPSIYLNHLRQTGPSQRDYSSYTPYFLDASSDVVAKAFHATTQFARSGWITGSIMDTHKAPFPALNVCRRNEPVATDTFYLDVPAIDNASRVAQFFCGVDTKFCDVYPVDTDADFSRVLLNNI